MRPLVKAALKIDELAYTLGNIATDQRIEIDALPDDEILSEARYVLDLFVNPAQGHINGEALRGEEGPAQRRWAQGQVRKLRGFIQRHS
jgi:hypothetical protein